jgi:RNA polymerase sigma factor for flagellar operon FliA
MSSVALTPALQKLVVRAMPMVHALANRRCRRCDPALFEELVAIGNATLAELAPQYDPEQGSFEAFASLRVRGAMIDHLRKVLPGHASEGNITPLTLSSPLREVSLAESLAQSESSEYADVLDTLSIPAFGMYASYIVGGIRDMEDEMAETLDMAKGRREIARFSAALGEPEQSMLRAYLRAEPVEDIARTVDLPARTVERRLQTLRAQLRDSVLGKTRGAAPSTTPVSAP